MSIHLIKEIRHGKIALPDIQRPFVYLKTEASPPEGLSLINGPAGPNTSADH